MPTSLDYQQIIDIVAQCIKIALPIGCAFGLGGKAVNFFLSLAFGEKNIKL